MKPPKTENQSSAAEPGHEREIANVAAEAKLKKFEMLKALRAVLKFQREAPPFEIAERAGPVPLSYAQQRLWFLHRLEPDSPAYHVPIVHRLTGDLDEAALEESLNVLVQRHDVLRSCFPHSEGVPRQEVASHIRLRLTRLDLRDVAADEKDAQAQRWIEDYLQDPFNLSEPPLLRCALLRLGENERVFVLLIHHIIFDGWSERILERDLDAIYASIVSGNGAPPPKKGAAQYADYACWQRSWLTDAVLEKQLGYWREKLAGCSETLELPTDRPRAPFQNHRGANLPFEFSPNLTEKLRALSRDTGQTVFVVLQTILKIMLYRYSGQTDIQIGVPSANRNRKEIQDIIGLIVNTLVMRTDLSGNPPFLKLLCRVGETASDAFRYQEFPFDRLVRALNPKKEGNRNPLFQVMFAYQNITHHGFRLKNIKATPFLKNWTVGMFDLILEMQDDETTLAGSVYYNAELFDEETIQRMADNLVTLATSAVATPELRIDDLAIVAEAEKRLLLEVWNADRMKAPEGKCIHHLFEEQVEKTPEAPAVIHDGRETSYAALNAASNRLAHRLIRQGIRTNDLVGVCMERSDAMIVAIMAILKAGAAYIPLDPNFPEERLTHMFEDSGASILLIQEFLRPRLTFKGPMIAVDSTQSVAGASAQNPAPALGAEDLAFVMYTSGSTGRPKGVMISHRSLVASTLSRFRFYPEAPYAYLFIAPLTFDSSVAAIFWTLSSGGALCVPREERLIDLHHLRCLIDTHHVSHMTTFPSFYREMLNAWEHGEQSSLKVVIATGETCHPDLAERHYRSSWAGAAALCNEYGPTEATVHSTMHRCLDQPGLPFLPIGKPAAHVTSYILDENDNPTPIGVPGELLIGGDGLARGYLNRPELTAQKFIANPFSDDPQSRLYRTGDLARYLPDGSIAFLGRIDHQVKLRGVRVEPGEIESRLFEHDLVQDAVVHLAGDRDAPFLAAYVVTTDNRDGQALRETLRAHLQKSLPGYMVPAHFIRLKSIPLTANGKADRQALPAPRATDLEGPETIAPRNARELELLNVWRDVLERNDIGVTDNFFDCGGHSLSAVRMLAKLASELGVEISLPALFECQTVEKLALAFEADAQTIATPTVMAFRRTGDAPPLFFVPGSGISALALSHVAKGLGAGHRFYGLQSPGLDGSVPPLNTVEDIAAHHLENILGLQKHGAYCLAGHSFGANIALEIARGLKERDKDVAFLGVCDMYAPCTDFSFFNVLTPADVVCEVALRMADIHGTDIRLDRELLAHLDVDGQARALHRCLNEAGVFPEGSGLSNLRAIIQVTQTELQTQYRIAPEKIAPIVLIRPEENGIAEEVERLDPTQKKLIDDPHLGWDVFSTHPVKLVKIPGDHHSILGDAHAPKLSETLRSFIERSCRN